MKVTFSFNQVYSLEQNAIRRTECYDLVRSYMGIPEGTFWSMDDMLEAVRSEFILYDNEYDELCFSIRGNEFVKKNIEHACEVEKAWVDVQNMFNNPKPSDLLPGYAGRLAKAVKKFKNLLDDTEW